MNSKIKSTNESQNKPKKLGRINTRPIKRWQEKYCSKCRWKCNPSEDRFKNCVLCDLIFTIIDVQSTLRKNMEKNSEGGQIANGSSNNYL